MPGVGRGAAASVGGPCGGGSAPVRQPDGVETRDTFAAFGLYGFVLVPLTYIATRIWTICPPGPVVGTGDEGSINGEMGLVLLIGAVSLTMIGVLSAVYSSTISLLGFLSLPIIGSEPLFRSRFSRFYASQTCDRVPRCVKTFAIADTMVRE